jgi:bla regulator protein BlaR1
MNTIPHLLLINSFKALALCLIFYMTQRAFRGKIKAKWRYIMWALVVARLVMPPLIPADFSFYNLGKFYYGTDIVHKLPLAISEISPLSAVIYSKIFTIFKSGTGILSGVWMAGTFYFLVLIILKSRYAVLSGKCLEDKKVSRHTRLLKECIAELGINKNVSLIESDYVSGPALCGIFKPAIILPSRFTEIISETELKYIFIHELTHLKRHDIIVNWAVSFIQAVHWFNPLAWKITAELNNAREEACDEAVLNFIGRPKAREYGQTLVNVLNIQNSGKTVKTASTFLRGNADIYHRILSIKYFRPEPKSMTVLGILIFVFTGTVFLTEASDLKLKNHKTNKEISLSSQTINKTNKITITKEIQNGEK